MGIQLQLQNQCQGPQVFCLPSYTQILASSVDLVRPDLISADKND